jgi:hypothetical protein
MMMPSGASAPRDAGKRFSSGAISQLPKGDHPAAASASRLATIIRCPSRLRRVNSSATPMRPMSIMRLERSEKKPRIFESGKNMPLTFRVMR